MIECVQTSPLSAKLIFVKPKSYSFFHKPYFLLKGCVDIIEKMKWNSSIVKGDHCRKMTMKKGQ